MITPSYEPMCIVNVKGKRGKNRKTLTDYSIKTGV
jgi:hypothetical protein